MAFSFAELLHMIDPSRGGGLNTVGDVAGEAFKMAGLPEPLPSDVRKDGSIALATMMPAMAGGTMGMGPMASMAYPGGGVGGPISGTSMLSSLMGGNGGLPQLLSGAAGVPGANGTGGMPVSVQPPAGGGGGLMGLLSILNGQQPTGGAGAGGGVAGNPNLMGLLGAGKGLLGASGPSPVPMSTNQMLAQGLGGFMQGQTQGANNQNTQAEAASRLAAGEQLRANAELSQRQLMDWASRNKARATIADMNDAKRQGLVNAPQSNQAQQALANMPVPPQAQQLSQQWQQWLQRRNGGQ